MDIWKEVFKDALPKRDSKKFPYKFLHKEKKNFEMYTSVYAYHEKGVWLSEKKK